MTTARHARPDGPKSELRARCRRVRESIPAARRAKADAAIAERLLSTEAYARAEAVLTYLSVADEVDTRAVVERAWDDGKLVALPRCVPRSRLMRWHAVTSLDGLERSPFGIDEPADDPSTALSVVGIRALAVVPALAFDAAGNRLGYGGGYYDAFLGGFGGLSAGLCREAQLVPDLVALGAVEPHDVPVDVVVTEGRAIARGGRGIVSSVGQRRGRLGLTGETWTHPPTRQSR